jgi:nitrous oxidase accessory protein
VVDDDQVQCHEATVTTIVAAVQQALPGTKIAVCPGIYNGGIVVDKAGLTIEVRGAHGSARIVGTGQADVGFGFAVIADDVTIEGFEISGFGNVFENAGIAIGGLWLPDQTVKLHPANGVVVTDNDIRSAPDGFAIHIWQSARTRIEHNTIQGGNTGLVSDAATDARIEQNSFSGFGNWGVLGSLPGAMIEHNLFYANAEEGMLLFESNGATVEQNTFRENFGGLFIRDSSDVRFKQNSFSQSGEGITIVTSHGIRVEHNVMEGGGNGINLTESDGVTVEDNRASGWGVGINLRQTTNSRISENTTDNNETGIQVMESAGNTFRHNSAHHNQVVDLTWDGLNSQHFSKNSCGTAIPSKAVWDCR